MANYMSNFNQCGPSGRLRPLAFFFWPPTRRRVLEEERQHVADCARMTSAFEAKMQRWGSSMVELERNLMRREGAR